jgi:hypothetical protein
MVKEIFLFYRAVLEKRKRARMKAKGKATANAIIA